MARADVANVAQRILPDGVRPDKGLIDKIEEAIDDTKVVVSEDASYAEAMAAKLKNEDDAVAKIKDSLFAPKPKAKAKAKPK